MQICAQKNNMIKHQSNWEAILCMSFFQHQKSIDIASIWSVQIENYFVQIDLGCSRPAIEHQQKEEANACYFNTRFNYYCTQSGYWLTLHRTFSDCCCWQRNIGIVQETKWNLDCECNFASSLSSSHHEEEELKHETLLVSYVHHHPLWILKTVIIHLSCLGRLDSATHESITGIMSFTLP